MESQENNLDEARLYIKQAYFTEELLYVNNWEDARSKFSPTSVMKITRSCAKELLPNAKNQELTSETHKREEVKRLRDLCQRHKSAEPGQGEDLLITVPLQNLATNFIDKSLHIVSIGAKGAGKTFNYIQLSRFK